MTERATRLALMRRFKTGATARALLSTPMFIGKTAISGTQPYWYSTAGRKPFSRSLDEEWVELAMELLKSV